MTKQEITIDEKLDKEADITSTNVYEDTGTTTKDGYKIFRHYTDDEKRFAAVIVVNGAPRIARVCGIVCGGNMAKSMNHGELIG